MSDRRAQQQEFVNRFKQGWFETEPDGRVVGREYVARNPTRADRRPGSFRINVHSGKWSDFATGDKGGDVVSLAAYLSGTGQGEAARSLADMLGVRHV